MQKYEFRVDVNTPYMKAIQFIGPLVMGLIIGVSIINYKNGIGINWMSAPTTIVLGFFFFFFPDFAKKYYIIIDDHGISNRHFKFHQKESDEIKWDTISAIRVDRNTIFIKKNIGSSEKIPLPLHTKEQISNLKIYLQEVTAAKDIEYLG